MVAGFASVLGGVAVVFTCAGVAQAAEHTLDLVERVGKFQAFYAEASGAAGARCAIRAVAEGLRLCGRAPGPQGDAMARTLLDGAWDKYPALLPKLPALLKEATDDGNEAFARIDELLETGDTPIHTRLVLYVGQFDNNAYSIPPMEGRDHDNAGGERQAEADAGA